MRTIGLVCAVLDEGLECIDGYYQRWDTHFLVQCSPLGEVRVRWVEVE